MDPPPFPNRVKEEWPASPLPRPMMGLPDSWPAPFLTKTYEMVEDEGTDQMVSWSKMSNSFIVWDPHSFSMDVLPKHFKHKNFSSFVRQLNTYGFKKVDPDKWEFAHEGFLRGQKHLLRTIKRRKVPAHCTPHQQPCPEIAGHELDGDADNLRRDKSLLMEEVVKLRKDQQNSRAQIQAMSEKLQGIEQKQQHLMKFFTRAIHNPHFLHQLAELQSRRKELEEAIYNKINSIMPSDAENSEARHDGFSELADRTLGVFELDEIEIEQSKEQQPDELNDELWQQFFEEMVSDEQGFAQKSSGGVKSSFASRRIKKAGGSFSKYFGLDTSQARQVKFSLQGGSKVYLGHISTRCKTPWRAMAFGACLVT